MSEWVDLCVPSEIAKILMDSGFETPTEIQRCVLPEAIRARSDILGAAPTGSGKTLAFGIPMVVRIIEEKKRMADSTSQVGRNDVNDESYQDENDCFPSAVAPVIPLPVAQKSKASKRRIEDVYQNLALIEELDADTGEVLHTHSLLKNSAPEIYCVAGERSRHKNMPRKSIDGRPSDRHVCGLVIAPTRELAMQIYRHLKTIADALPTEVRVEAIVGGISIQKQSRLLRSSPDILVATPGRLWHMIQEGNQEVCSLQRNVDILVVDEADRLVEANHFDELRKLLTWLDGSTESSAAGDRDDVNEVVDNQMGESLKQTCKRKKRQTMVFSATLTFVHQGAVRPGGKRLKHRPCEKMTKELKLSTLRTLLGLSSRAKVFDLSSKPVDVIEAGISTKTGHENKSTLIGLAAPEGLQEFRVLCPDQLSKDVNLFWFLAFARHFQVSPREDGDQSIHCVGNSARTMVFMNSKSGVRRLAGVMRRLTDTNAFSVSGRPVAQRISVLHADMPQKQRLRALEQFQVDPYGILFTSDVASRGLDLAMETAPNEAGVAWVVHFEVPHTAELYVHRRGRTARAHKTGASVLLLGPNETTKWRRMVASLARNSGGTAVDLGSVDLPDLPILASKYEWMACERIVDLARQLDLTEHSAARQKANDSWFTRAAKDADIIFEPDSDEEGDENHGKRSRKSVGNSRSSHNQQQFVGLRSQLRKLVLDCTQSLRTKPSGQQVVPPKTLLSGIRKRLKRLQKHRSAVICEG